MFLGCSIEKLGSHRYKVGRSIMPSWGMHARIAYVMHIYCIYRQASVECEVATVPPLMECVWSCYERKPQAPSRSDGPV